MAEAQKIQDIDVLAVILGKLKSQGKRIVQCHGVFDLLHVGHIRYFNSAKSSVTYWWSASRQTPMSTRVPDVRHFHMTYARKRLLRWTRWTLW